VIGLPAPGLVFLLAAGFEVNAGVIAEARGGEAPAFPGREPSAAAVGVLTPAVDLGLRERGFQTRLGYAPRLFWRRQNELNDERPLILHNLRFEMQQQASRDTALRAAALVSWGEADYSTLPRLLGPGQGALPTPTRLFSATVETGARVEMSRTWRLELGLDVGHRRPLGDAITPPPPAPGEPPPPPVLPFPEGTTAAARPTSTHRLSRRDELAATSGVVYATYTSGIRTLSWVPELGWRHRLSRATDLRLGAGVAYTVDLDSQTQNTSALGGWSPIADAQINTRVRLRRGGELRASAQAEMDFVVDPVLGTVGRRGLTIGRLALLIAPDWTIGVDGLFATSLRADPLPGEPDETVASVAVPVQHRLSDYLVIEVGGRWSDRGPHLRADDFTFHQRELWIYASLIASTRSAARWTTQ
jgi:hypothetical protein